MLGHELIDCITWNRPVFRLSSTFRGSLRFFHPVFILPLLSRSLSIGHLVVKLLKRQLLVIYFS